jgi:hypothetical protein
MKVQMDRLAVALLVAIALFWTAGMVAVAIVAAFTGGWYVTAAIVAFVLVVVGIYRITEVRR